MIQIANLFGRHKQGGMVRQLAGQVMNGVSLTCAREAIEQQPFFDWQAKFLQLFSLLNKTDYIPIKQPQGFLWEDDILSADGSEFVNPQIASISAISVCHLKRNDLPFVGSRSFNHLLNFLQQTARKVRAPFSGWNCDFQMRATCLSITLRRAH